MYYKKLLLILFIFLYLICFTFQAIIPVKIYNLLGSYQTTSYLGDPKQLVLSDIGFDINFSIVTNFFFKLDSLTLFNKGNQTIKIGSNKIEAFQLSDTLYLQRGSVETKINSFNFYHVKDTYTITISNVLSFAFKYDNLDYSLIHQLYRRNDIPKLGFYLSYSEMYLGGLPQNDIFKSIYNATILVNNNDKYKDEISWGGNLKYIYFNNDANKGISNDKYAYFNPNTYFIYAPNKFMEYLNETIMNKLINENICGYIKDAKEYVYQCRCSSIDNFPSFNFIFDKYSFQLTKEELFSQDLLMCLFKIKENQEDKWKFGTSFLDKFPAYYDYENKTITFYNEKPFKSVDLGTQNVKSFKIRFDILIINIIQLFTMSITLLILKIKD